MAQYAYNSTTSEAIGFSLFYASYGFQPTAYYEPEYDESPAQAAQLKVDQLKALHKQLTEDIRFVAYRMAKYYDNGRLTEPIFKKGEKVFLIQRNFKTKRPNKKLDHVKAGLFKVIDMTRKNTY